MPYFCRIFHLKCRTFCLEKRQIPYFNALEIATLTHIDGGRNHLTIKMHKICVFENEKSVDAFSASALGPTSTPPPLAYSPNYQCVAASILARP